MRAYGAWYAAAVAFAVLTAASGAALLPAAVAESHHASDCLLLSAGEATPPPPSDTARELLVEAGNWATSLAVSHLLAILLRERAGTPATVVVGDSDLAAQVLRVNEGTSHVLAEAWPGNLAVVQEDPSVEAVDVLGLGLVASAGWYFPSYLLEDHPELADYEAIDDGVFGDRVYAAPSDWRSEDSCKSGGIFENLGLNVTCDRKTGEAELVELLTIEYAAGNAFLIYLWRPLAVFDNYNLTRVKLPCYDAECFARLECDYPSTPMHKLAWSELPLFFPALAVELVDNLAITNGDIEAIVASAANTSSAALEEAACGWAGAHSAELADVVRIEGALYVWSVKPAIVPARGGAVVTISGTGFGRLRPDFFVAEVGGVACLDTKWMSQTLAECTVAPGAGEGVAVHVRVGSIGVTLDNALSFEPATLYGVTPADADDSQADSTDNAGDTSDNADGRFAVTGQRVVVHGDNFVRSARMQCRFGDVVVQAVFLNFTAVECVVPHIDTGSGPAFVPLAVTNDGVRWRSGLELASTSGMVWPGGIVGIVPIDTSPASSPLEVPVVATVANEVPYTQEALQYCADLVNDDPNVLRHTHLNLVTPDLSHMLGMDQAQRQAAFTQLLADVRVDHPYAIATHGFYSSISMPSAAASAEDATPWVEVAWFSNNPSLSNTSRFPYFMRTSPSDLFSADAIVETLLFLEPQLVSDGLMDADTRAIGVFYVDDDPFSTGYALALIAKAQSVGITCEPIVSVTWQDLPSADGDGGTARASALEGVFAPFVAAEDVKIIAVPLTPTEAAEVVPAAVATGVADDSHVWLYSDNSNPGFPFVLSAVYSDGDQAHPLREQVQTYTASIVDGGVAWWPLSMCDAVYAFARAFDSMIASKRSPEPADYADPIELNRVLRTQAADWPSFAQYGGFSYANNDPRTSTYSVYNIAFGQSREVGSVYDGIVVLHDSVTLSAGAAFAFTAPTHATVVVCVELLGDDGDLAAGDQHAIAGLATAVKHLNELVASGLDGATTSSSSVANLTLRLDVVDIGATGGAAAALDRARSRGDAHAVGNRHIIAGAVCLSSAACLDVLEAASARDLAVLSPSASLDALSDPRAYPLFARVAPRDQHQAAALVDVTARFGWATLATVRVDDEPYSADLERAYVAAASRSGASVSHRVAVSTASTDADILGALEPTVADDVRVFVLLATAADACRILAVVEDAGLVGAGYVWVGSDGWIGHPLCDVSGTLEAQQSLASAVNHSIGVNPSARLDATSDTTLLDIALEATQPPLEDPLSGMVGDDAAVDAITAWRAGLAGTDASQVALNFKASRGYDVVAVLSDTLRRMFAATQDGSHGADVALFWRGAAGIVGVSDVFSFRAHSNEPRFSGQDVVSRRAADDGTGVALNTVGKHTDRGFLNLEGCPPGATRDAGASACERCPVNTYKSEVGDMECTPCAASSSAGGTALTRIEQMVTGGVRGATSAAQCLCPSGFVAAWPGSAAYAEQGSAQFDHAFRCNVCPEHGVCEGIGIVLADVKNDIGYWRGHPNSTDFAKCLDAASCAVSAPPIRSADVAAQFGAQAVPNEWGSPCSEGHYGPLCAVCLPGWGRVGDSHLCTPCTGTAASVGTVMIMVFSTIGLVVILTYWQFSASSLSPHAMRRTSNIKVLLSWLQFTSFLRLFKLSWSSPMLELFGVQKAVLTSPVTFVAMECLVNDAHNVAYSSFILHMSVPMGVVALAVVTLSVAHVVDSCRVRRLRELLGTAARMSWKERVRRLSNARTSPATKASASRVAESKPDPDAADASRSDSTPKSPTNVISRSRRVTPATGAQPPKTGMATPSTPTRQRSKRAAMAVSAAATGASAPRLFDIEWIIDFFVALLTVVLFLSWPYLCNSVFTLLDCADVGDASYLRDDTSIDCNSDTYKVYSYTAWAFYVIYGLGIPAWTVALLAYHYRWLFMLSVDTTVPAARKMRSSDAWHLRRIVDHVSSSMYWAQAPAVLASVADSDGGSRTVAVDGNAFGSTRALVDLTGSTFEVGPHGALPNQKKAQRRGAGSRTAAPAAGAGAGAAALAGPPAVARLPSPHGASAGDAESSLKQDRKTLRPSKSEGSHGKSKPRLRQGWSVDEGHIMRGVNPITAFLRGFGFLVGATPMPTTNHVHEHLIQQAMTGRRTSPEGPTRSSAAARHHSSGNHAKHNAVEPMHPATERRINRLLHSLNYKVNAARSKKLVELRGRFDLIHRALVLDFCARVAVTVDTERQLARIDDSSEVWGVDDESADLARAAEEAELDERAYYALKGLSASTLLMLRLFVPRESRSTHGARLSGASGDAKLAVVRDADDAPPTAADGPGDVKQEAPVARDAGAPPAGSEHQGADTGTSTHKDASSPRGDQWVAMETAAGTARALERARKVAEAEGLGAKLLDDDEWYETLQRMRASTVQMQRSRTMAAQSMAAMADTVSDSYEEEETESVEATVRRLQIAAASTRQVTTPEDLNRCLVLLESSFSDGAARVVMDPRLTVDEVMMDCGDRVHAVNRATRKAGFLYDTFRPGNEFFELVKMARKQALIATAIFLTTHGPMIQGTVAMLIVFLSLVRSYMLHPYQQISAFELHLPYEPRVMRIIKRAFDVFLNSRRLLWDAGLPSDVQLHEHEPPPYANMPLSVRLPEHWGPGRLDKLALSATFISLVVGMLSTAMANDGFASDFAGGTHAKGSGSTDDVETFADVLVILLRATVFLVNAGVMSLFAAVIAMDAWHEFKDHLPAWCTTAPPVPSPADASDTDAGSSTPSRVSPAPADMLKKTYSGWHQQLHKSAHGRRGH